MKTYFENLFATQLFLHFYNFVYFLKNISLLYNPTLKTPIKTLNLLSHYLCNILQYLYLLTRELKEKLFVKQEIKFNLNSIIEKNVK